MHTVFADFPPLIWIAAAAITFLAGFVKGAVGFAMPMIMISGLGSILPAEIALAALILPTVATNLYQALRGGLGPAREVLRRYRRYILALLVCLAITAQIVGLVSQNLLFAMIGVPVVALSLLMLSGIRIELRPENRRRDELVVGGIAGALGGLAGTWGPPTVIFLTAAGAEKSVSMRAQGVIYGIGALALLAAHLKSGVMNAATWPLSAAAILPALAGMWLGYALHDRMPQTAFRRVTLVVLTVAGLNLIRRAIFA